VVDVVCRTNAYLNRIASLMLEAYRT